MEEQIEIPELEDDDACGIPPTPIPLRHISSFTLEYYDRPGRKVLDYLIGFFGIIAVGFVSALIAGSLYLGMASSAGPVVAGLLAIIISLMANRRFIAFGVITVGVLAVCAIPLLLLGACLRGI